MKYPWNIIDFIWCLCYRMNFGRASATGKPNAVLEAKLAMVIICVVPSKWILLAYQRESISKMCCRWKDYGLDNEYRTWKKDETNFRPLCHLLSQLTRIILSFFSCEMRSTLPSFSDSTTQHNISLPANCHYDRLNFPLLSLILITFSANSLPNS